MEALFFVLNVEQGCYLLDRNYRFCSMCGLESVGGQTSLSVKVQQIISPVLSSVCWAAHGYMCAGCSYYHPWENTELEVEKKSFFSEC